MSLGKIRIEGSGPNGRNHRVFLDGHDISKFVNYMNITIRADGLNEIEMTMVGGVEFSEEFEALVDFYRSEAQKREEGIEVTGLGDRVRHYITGEPIE